MTPSETPTLPDPTFTRLVIDGIPSYVAQGAPRYTGMLQFRVGRADEPLRHAGISHLVEHLALFTLGEHQPYWFNGWVGSLTTAFFATGTPEEVGAFLNAVAKALRGLPLGRIPDETRVLMTEASARSGGPAGELLWFRYGATGHGQVSLPEFGLVDPKPEVVEEWARTRFTAGNAALWFTGSPPANLALDLPPGARFAPPPLVPVPDVVCPAWTHASPGVVGVSFVAPRADWLSVPLGIAAERVRSRLRFERGVLYDVAVQYDPILRDTAHACLWAACLTEHETAVRDGVVEVLEDMAGAGATPEELVRVRERNRRGLMDPDAIADLLSGRVARASPRRLCPASSRSDAVVAAAC